MVITDQNLQMNATLVIQAVQYVLLLIDVKFVFSDMSYGPISLVMLLAQLDGLQ